MPDHADSARTVFFGLFCVGLSMDLTALNFRANQTRDSCYQRDDGSLQRGSRLAGKRRD